MDNSPQLARQFATLYEKFQRDIFRFAYLRIGDKEMAKDLTQQTFLQAWKYVQSGGEIDNAKAFFYQIARNLVIDWYRRKKESSLDEMMEKDGYDAPDLHSMQEIENQSELNLVLKAMEKLPKSEYDMLTLRYMDGLQVKEVAKLLGKPSNTVAVEIHRALAKLRRLINKKST